jgi:predicted secreted acid phosphatase
MLSLLSKVIGVSMKKEYKKLDVEEVVIENSDYCGALSQAEEGDNPIGWTWGQ